MAGPTKHFFVPSDKKNDALGALFVAGVRCSWFLRSRPLN